MSLGIRNKIANTIDNHYAAHPNAAAIRDQLDAAGVAPLADSAHTTGQAVIDARHEKRRQQIRDGEAFVPNAAQHAAHTAVEQVTAEHRIPVEVTHPDGPIEAA